MTVTELDTLWETVKSLPPGDRLRLRERIDASLTERPAPPVTTALDRVLLERGVITTVPKGVSVADFESWQPIDVEGPPVSQTIIEERR
jgi:hypothetical protein